MKCLLRSSVHFSTGLVFWLLSCVRCLYVLKINPSLVASYPDIFFPVFKLSFHFVYSFLCCTKLISLIRSHLFIFAFISIALGD